jgi:hypothetical protein
MPDLEKVKQIVKNEAQTSLIIGAVGYAVSKYAAGASGRISAPVIGSPVDVNIAIGVAIGSSNFIGAVVEDALEEYFPNNEYLEPVSMMVRPAVNGLVNYQLMRSGVSNNINVQVPVLAGAVSTVVGQYIGDNLIGFEKAF